VRRTGACHEPGSVLLVDARRTAEVRRTVFGAAWTTGAVLPEKDEDVDEVGQSNTDGDEHGVVLADCGHQLPDSDPGEHPSHEEAQLEGGDPEHAPLGRCLADDV